MNEVFRSSEFWMGVLGVVGTVLEHMNIVSRATWEPMVPGILAYIVGRVGSKVAKAAIKPSNGGKS